MNKFTFSYPTRVYFGEGWIAAYCFDFRGGGGSRSDGDTTEMSVMTEVSDLEVIMKAASEWDFVDKISGLVLMYPAFLVHDAVHEQFDSLEDVPDTYSDRAAEVYEKTIHYLPHSKRIRRKNHRGVYGNG